MAYSLVSLFEDDKLVDAVVPSNWIVGEKIYWSNSTFATRDLKNRVEVNYSWPCYTLDRIRFSHDKFDECEQYHFSSANEEESEKTSKKKPFEIPKLPVPPNGNNTSIAKSSAKKVPSTPRRSPRKSPGATLDKSPAKSPRRKYDARASPSASQVQFETATSSNTQSWFSLKSSDPIGKRNTKKYEASLKRSCTVSDEEDSLSSSQNSFSHSSNKRNRFSSSFLNETSEMEESLSQLKEDLTKISKPNRKNGAAYNKSKYPLTEAEFQRKVISLLVEILENLKDRNSDLPSSKEDYHVSPCETLEELLELEREINGEQEYQLLVRQLSRVGGKSVANIAKNVLDTVARNEVWVLFSLHGQRGKRKFLSMKLCQAVTCAVMKCCRETKSHVEKSIGSVIKHASERVKRNE